MPAVNADITELLQACKNIQTAISSINATKDGISRKYRDLGNGWKDKKYNELGAVLQECNRALNDVLKTLTTGEKYVSALAKSLAEYENTTLGTASEQGQTAGGKGEFGSSAGFQSSGGGILSSLFNRKKNIRDALKGVEHRPIVAATSSRSEEQIISSISGGDMTDGSCSSLALAYAGNRAGYVVFDFRDGQSRDVFSTRSNIEQIANMDGVNSVILHGTDDTVCAEQLLSNMVPGREYYLGTGGHAAIVRLSSTGNWQYLELQSGIPSENGWHPLTTRALYDRFGCEDGQSGESASYLIELESLQNNAEFLDLLGYINTDESAQVRGASGHVR